MLRRAPYICHILQANSKRYANIAYISIKLLTDAGDKSLIRFQGVGSGKGVFLISQKSWDQMIADYYQLKEGSGNLAIKAIEAIGAHPVMAERMRSLVSQIGNEGDADNDDEGDNVGFNMNDDNDDPQPPRPPAAAPRPPPQQNPGNAGNIAPQPRGPPPAQIPPPNLNPGNDDNTDDDDQGGDQGGEQMIVEVEQHAIPVEPQVPQEVPTPQQSGEVTPSRREVAFREPPTRTQSISSRLLEPQWLERQRFMRHHQLWRLIPDLFRFPPLRKEQERDKGTL